ncbi:MAG: 3-oxoacyl-ACP synthase III [Myxococcota bacterium]
MFAHVHIESLAFDEAPIRVTSAALEDQLSDTYGRLGIPSRCIESLVGIVARRFWPVGADMVQAATAVAARCIDEAGIPRERIGLLVNCSVTKEVLEPSMASMIHGDLGLAPTALNYDISNACLGFLSAMDVAARMLESGAIDYALVVAAESSRRVVENTVEALRHPSSTMQQYKEWLPTLTLGSGACAMLLSRGRVARSPTRLLGVVARAATMHSRVCVGTWEQMRTDAPKLLSEGVALAERTWQAAVETFGWSDASLRQYICHQVGAGHLATLMKRLALPVEKAFPTYPELGNMGSIAVPCTLRLALDDGVIGRGDAVALMGIGSGLNCSMAHVAY